MQVLQHSIHNKDNDGLRQMAMQSEYDLMVRLLTYVIKGREKQRNILYNNLLFVKSLPLKDE